MVEFEPGVPQNHVTQPQKNNSDRKSGTSADPLRQRSYHGQPLDSETDRDGEAHLIAQAQLGSATAFGELVRIYQDRVLRLCRRLTGSQIDAEDLAQEAFVRAFRAIDQFDDRARFYTWIYRITVNFAISEARKTARRPSKKSLTQPDGKGLDGSIPHKGNEPRDHLMEAERRVQIRMALAELDPEHRSVLTLRDMESLSYDEIAEILDIPLGTVKSRVHRARLALRERLKQIVD